jgi:hypothetical protein
MGDTVSVKKWKCSKCGVMDDERISVVLEVNRGSHKRHVIPMCSQCVDAFLSVAEYSLVPNALNAAKPTDPAVTDAQPIE